MKGNHPVITLLGSNSGNNAGDAAILASILDTLGKEMPDAEFLVPTTNPKFIVDSYASKYNVKAINVMPWTGSIRLFGIPVFRAFLKSDIALICDGIIFDVKLFNPLFNFLITLVPLIGFSKVTGCKLGCYSCGIGPLRSFWGRTFARWVINACDFVTMRERDSLALCREIGVTKPIEITGDAAFLNAVSEESKADEISRSLGIPLNQPLFGINVTSYIDQWLDSSQKVGSKDAYLTTLAEAITAARQALTTPFYPVVFSTHPMDLEFANELASRIGGTVMSNTKYLSHDLQCIMRRCELFMGMRFHSVVLASAVYSPVIGLIYAPKVRGFMRLLECEEFGLELANLSKDSLSATLIKGWEQRSQLQEKQRKIIDELKAGAWQAARSLRETILPSSEGKFEAAAKAI